MFHNFISYNNLNFEDARLFFALGFNNYLDKARQIVFKNKITANYVEFESLHFDQDNLDYLNSRIIDILELVGRYTNIRYTTFKKTNPEDPEVTSQDIAMEQHQFFNKASERESFAAHLLFSMLFKKMKVQELKNSSFEKNILTTPFSTVEKELKKIKGGKRFTYGPSQMSHMEARAVGVYYMVNLIWLTAKESLLKQKSIATREQAIIGLVKSSFGMFSLLNTLDEYLSRSAGGNVSNGNNKALHNIVDQVTVKNLEKTQKEIIWIARIQCKEEQVPFYKNDSAAAKRISAVKKQNKGILKII